MQALAFWRTVTADHGFLDRILDLVRGHGIRYCVVGGQAVNAYVEPLVSLDLALTVAARDAERLEPLLASRFRVERFAHSLNVGETGSDLRVKIQTDERYASFPERARMLEVLGLELPVASVEDVLAGKVWAVQDPTRGPSKRQKDLADIARLVERYPELVPRVPAEVLARLL